MRPSRLLFPVIPAVVGTLLISAANPSCSGPSSGPRQFGADTLVIPMDECWQPYTNGNKPSSGDVEPAGGTGLGGVCSSAYTMGTLYAYGFVYNLIVNGVTVYWAIDPSKTSVTAPDVTVPGSTSQATLYDFSAATAHAAANGTAIGVQSAGSSDSECPVSGTCYRGGPFLIDGADFVTVYNLLQTPAFASFKNQIHLHVMHPTNPFTAPINRSLVGTPPTIAILAAPGVDCFQTSPILDQYLIDANLPTTVYQSLYASDLSDGTGSLASSTLKNYSLLWIPHFYLDDLVGDYASPASTTVTCNPYPPTQLTPAQASNVASVIGQFVTAGGNLFAECAGISALEGDDGYVGENNLSSNSEFQSTAGLTGDFGSVGPLTYFHPESPFMQFGDFPFTAKTGYVGAWVPQASYYPGVTSLIQTGEVYANYNDAVNNVVTSQTSDVLTWLPAASTSASAGNVVYLGGHSYTNYTDPNNNTTWQQNVAGERMVLNTLLTLSANCTVPTADGGSCDTGLLGVCAAGSYACVNGSLVCNRINQPSAEICDGLDNNCDGLVDNGVPPQSCYDGPAGTEDCQGAAGTPGYPCACHGGSQFCIDGMFGVCTGEALPTMEICNGVDDDCDGFVDNVPGTSNPLSEACYNGPPGTEGVGLCVGGMQVCADGGTWGTCQGEVTPVYGACDGLDHDCNGIADTCATCAAGTTRGCYDGPSGTLGVGLCRPGTQACLDGGWATGCSGETLPVYDGGFCDGLDHSCDNQPDICSACTPGDNRPCYTGPAGTEGIGICKGGTQTCDTGGTWGVCLGEVLPVGEICDGLDDNCNGRVDDGAPCPGSDICVNGVCVPGICGGEIGGNCPRGYACASGACAVAGCGDGGICAAGDTCQADGGCLNPCTGANCGPGAICAGGQCLAGGCTSTGCGPDGGVCVQGNCIPDPCASVSCVDGTFCRQGFCVQACAFLTCPAGQICDTDGQCVPPPCGGSCGATQACIDGGCTPNPCTGLVCAAGQVCDLGNCVDDPCATVHCPGQIACVAGQCVDSLRDGGTFGSAGSTGSVGSSGTGTGATGGATTSTAGTTGASASGSTGGATTGASASGSGTSANARSGCGCGTSSDPLGAWPVLGLVFGLRAFGRRRRRGTPRSALLALLLAACSTTNPNGLTTGASSGSGSSSGIGLSNGTTSSSGTTTSSSSGGTGCTICGSACVLLGSDPQSCGACGHACASGERCVFGACGPNGPVAPTLRSLTPDTGAFGTMLSVALVGTGFTAQTQVLVTGTGVPSNDLLPVTFADSAHLTLQLSLLTITGGTIDLAALNPGNLLSNALPFTVTSPGSPALLTVTPRSAPTGAPAILAFTGTGLDTNTEIHAVGGAFVDQAIPTSGQTGTAASATWDLTSVPPGNYSLYALTPGAPQSNVLSFTVTSTGPALISITPMSAASNTQPAVAITGSGFDSSSIILFGPAGSVTSSEATALTGPTSLTGTLDLTGVGPGSYQVMVQNAGPLTSGTLPFTVFSVAALISSVSPNSAAAGTIVPLMVAGSGFDPTSVVHFQGSGSLDVALPSSPQSDSELGATLDLTSIAAGTYSLVVENAGVSPSNAIGFTVTQNSPSLSGISPDSVSQDSGNQVITLTGAALQSGSTVTFQAVGSSASFTLPLTVSTGSTQGTVSLNPSLEPVASYLVTVTSPSNAVSNPGTFAIEPGTPILDQISPSSAGQVPVLVILCGQYLVPGLSTVHVTGLNTDEILTGTFGGSSGCPGSSDSSITLSTDLTHASPGAYQTTVWNGTTLVSNVETFTVNGP